jgi:hypothetical protein
MGIRRRNRNNQEYDHHHPEKSLRWTPSSAGLRAEVIEKMKESRASAEKLLAIHEEEKRS